MNRRGFSLVEILVVIAIIVILAALAFPVMASAKHRAKQTTCMSNMHQKALAHQIEGSVAPKLECPLSEQFGVNYYYLQNQKLAMALEVADPGAAYYICYLHGKHVGPDTRPADFSGNVLRLRPDGSVQVRSVDRKCLNGVPFRSDWMLFSDVPCPPEFCPAGLTACD